MFDAFFPIMGRTLAKGITLNSCCPVHSLITTSPSQQQSVPTPASLTSPEAGTHNPSLEVRVPAPWHPSYTLLKSHQQPDMPPPPPSESQICRGPPLSSWFPKPYILVVASGSCYHGVACVYSFNPPILNHPYCYSYCVFCLSVFLTGL